VKKLKAIKIAAHHPAFAGHFPTFPVLPGAILLDETLRVIGCDSALDFTQWQVASAKFLNVVRPGDVLDLEYEAVSPHLIRFTLRVQDRKVASGTLANGPQGTAP
jgi:3-hydroxyacyl-[acyl-carrier-protein] dehydratase